MTFEEFIKAKKNNEEYKGTKKATTTTTTKSTSKSTTKSNAKTSGNSAVSKESVSATSQRATSSSNRKKTFAEFVANKKANSSADGWARSSENLVKEVNQYYSKYREDDEEQYTAFQDRISDLLSVADTWRKQFAGDAEVTSYINSVVSVLSKAKSVSSKYRKHYSQYKTEAEYNDAVKQSELYGMSTEELAPYVKDSSAATEALKKERQTIQKNINLYQRAGDRTTYKNYKDVEAARKRVEEIDAELEKNEVGIAYTTLGGKNITWQSLYDQKKQEEDFGSLYAELSAKDDWEEQSKYRRTYDPKDWSGFSDADLEYENANGFNIGGASRMASGTATPNDSTEWGSYSTDEEKAVFNYIYHTEGRDAALEWYNSRVDIYRGRSETEAIKNAVKFAEDYPGLSDIVAIGQSVFSGSEYISDILQGDIGDTNTMANVSSAIKGTRMEQIDWEIGEWDAFDFLYGTGTSMIESVAATALFGKAGGIALGLSAAAQGTNDALNRGMSKGQAFSSGFWSGVFEGVFESLSIGNFNALKELPATSFKEVAKNVGKSMLVNASEEALTEIANIAYDTIINGDFSQLETSVRLNVNSGMSEEEARRTAILDAVAQVGEAAASGALMGIGFGSLASGIGYATGAAEANSIYGNTKEDIQALVSEALEIDPDNALAKKLQSKLDSDKRVSGGQLNALVHQNEKTMLAQDVASIETAASNRLTELGETGDVKAISAALAKQAAGEKLSTAEQRTISNSKYGQRVSNELNTENIKSGDYSTAWAEQLDTNRINPVEYSRLASDVEGAKDVSVQEDAGTVTLDGASKKYGAQAGAMVHTYQQGQDVEKYDSAYEIAFDMGKNGVNPDYAMNSESVSYLTESQRQLAYEAGQAAASSVSQESNDTQEDNLATSFDHIGIDPSYRDSYISGFVADDFKTSDGKIAANAVDQYAIAYKEAVDFGKLGIEVKTEAEAKAEGKPLVERSKFAYKLNKAARESAYKAGMEIAQKSTDAAQAKLDAAVAERKASGKGKAKTTGKIHYDAKKINNNMRRAGLQLGKRLAALGIDVYLFESHKDASGNYVDDNGKLADNGYYIAGDGSIHIDLNAGITGKGVMIYTMAHELGHFMKDRNEREFKIFAELLVKWYGKKGVSVTDLVYERMAEEDIGWDEAYEEVIARSIESFLTDSNIAERLVELEKTDKKTFQIIRDWIRRFMNWVRSLYQDVDPESEEGRMFKEWSSEIQEIHDAFYNTLSGAIETNQWIGSIADAITTEETISAAGIEVDADTGSAVMHSVRYAPKTQAEIDKVAKALSESLGVSVEKAREWVKSETSLTRIILDPSNAMFLDYEADDRYEAIKKNAEYPQGTVDFSNLCKKRREFTALLDKLQKEHPNRIITAEEMEKIRQILIDENVEVACGLCYVEERRQLLGEIAQKFIDGYNNGTLKEAIAKELDGNDSYVPTIYDLITYDGYRALTVEHPSIAQAFKKFNNARGMQAGRLIEGIAEYKRDILKWSQEKVDFVNSVGGLRVFSFSDFEATHLIDLVQVIQDCAVKGVMIQAYTKVPAFANAVKDTNMKVNRSLIAKGTGIKYENGRTVLDLDPVEGIDINDKDFFDSTDSENVGNVLVGMSDEQIRLAMKTAFVDYIIPFHTSLKGEILKAKKIDHWDNYKNFQTDKEFHPEKVTYNKDGSLKSDGWVVAEKQINIYVDVIQAAEAEGKPITNKVEFVNKFLAVAKEKGLKPRFWRFLDVDANGEYVYTEGYHKFLVDFKLFDQQGNILQQKPVVPVFDDALNARILNEYVAGKKAPVTRDAVYDRLVNEVIKHSKRKAAIKKSPPSKSALAIYTEEQYNAFGWASYNKVITANERETLLSRFADFKHNRNKYPITRWGEAVLHSTEAPRVIIYVRASSTIKMPEITRVVKIVADDVSDINKIRERIVANEFEQKLLPYDAITDYYGEEYLEFHRKRDYASFRSYQDSIRKREGGQEINPDSGELQDGGRNDRGGIEGYRSDDSRIKRSSRKKAPTFYSYMGVVVDGVKQDKLGAASVINLLKGKGVKAEEIKWSGIETWLEGKKSVTKAELQEFIAGSQLQIDEEILDNKDRPYSEDQQKRLTEYETKRDEIADKVASEWEKITDEKFPIRNTGAGLESAVANAIIDFNLEEKKATGFFSLDISQIWWLRI